MRAQPKPPAQPRLTSMSRVDPAKIDRGLVRWNNEMLSQTLRSLWDSDGGGIRMPFTVYTHRMLGALRRRFDRKGWTLRARTELERGSIVLWIKQRHRGYRGRD